MILEKFQPSHKLHFKRFYKTQPPPWSLMMNGTEGGVMRGWRSFLECLLLICLKGNCQTWWDKSQLFLDGMKSRIARFLQCFFSCVAFFDRNLNSKKSAPILWSWDFSHFFPDIWVCQMVSQTSPKPCDTCFCTKNSCFMGWEKQQKPLFWNCKAPREKPIVSHLPINTRKASLLCKIFFVCFGLLDQKSPEFGRYPSRFFFLFGACVWHAPSSPCGCTNDFRMIFFKVRFDHKKCANG